MDGVFECFVPEDRDRGLRQGMPASELTALKMKTRTAIPTGRYEIVISFSDRFKKLLPLFLDVPAFGGIRIHPGNSTENTDGCLLPGTSKRPDFVGSSKVAFTALFDKIKKAIHSEKIFITVR